jgi:hypothetical protein
MEEFRHVVVRFNYAQNDDDRLQYEPILTSWLNSPEVFDVVLYILDSHDFQDCVTS